MCVHTHTYVYNVDTYVCVTTYIACVYTFCVISAVVLADIRALHDIKLVCAAGSAIHACELTKQCGYMSSLEFRV